MATSTFQNLGGGTVLKTMYQITEDSVSSVVKEGKTFIDYECNTSILIFAKEGFPSHCTIDYSANIGKTYRVRYYDSGERQGQFFAQHKNKFYPVGHFVCGYAKQPCIVV